MYVRRKKPLNREGSQGNNFLVLSDSESTVIVTWEQFTTLRFVLEMHNKYKPTIDASKFKWKKVLNPYQYLLKIYDIEKIFALIMQLPT